MSSNTFDIRDPSAEPTETESTEPEPTETESTETEPTSVADAEFSASDGILVVEDLRKEFEGLTAVDGLSFTVDEGEILGFVGPNGAGKTTTVDCITGIYTPTSGSIHYLGEDVTGKSAKAMTKRGLARTYQEPRPLEDRTVLENIKLALVPNRVVSLVTFSDEPRRKAALICERLGLGKKMALKPDELSDADRVRMELARAIATDPDLLLVDEPFAGLSSEAVQDLVEIFEDLHDHGLTIVIVDHDIRGIQDLVDRAVVVTAGSKVAEGPPEELAADPEIQAANLAGDEE